MCGHQHTESQTWFACRHLLKLCARGIVSISKFFLCFLTSEISFRMFRLQSEESSEIRIPDIQISALVTGSVITCSHLIFSTRKSHSGWEMMRPWWFQHMDIPPTHFNQWTLFRSSWRANHIHYSPGAVWCTQHCPIYLFYNHGENILLEIS